MKADEELLLHIEAIVNGVVASFPRFVQKKLQPHTFRLVKNLSKTLKLYVEGKIRENKEEKYEN